MSIESVTTITDSIDNTGLSLAATGSVTEGGQITYTATLTNPAGTPMTVTLSNGAVINIEAGKTTGSVVVDTPANDVYKNGSTVSTTIESTSGGNGFYVTLTNAGEKAVNAPLTVSGYTYFGTNQPANPKTNPNMCYPNLGIARGYAINFLDGSGMNSNRFVQFDGGGMPPSPIFGLVQLPTAGGGTLLTPVLIGGGNQLGLVGGNNTSSLGSQKVVPPGTGKRKRTYWYIEGVK